MDTLERPARSPRVVAIVVTFEPDPADLNTVLAALRPQVAAMVVVDNGSRDVAGLTLPTAARQPIHWVRLGENLGIAAAQNRGIEWARVHGADYVLLSDQDSEPAPDMVRQLLSAARELARQGVPLGLVAPDFVDDRQAVRIPFMHIADGRPRWFGCAGADGTAEITTAIASGSLIPLATLDAVGPMRESMFIDLVDIEWCFRANSLGFRAFGVCAAKLRHHLGEQPARLLGRTLSRHSPLRNYYFYRNAVWLLRQGYVASAWKRTIARQMLKRYVVFSLFVHPRMGYLRMMSLGLLHGLRGRSGPL